MTLKGAASLVWLDLPGTASQEPMEEGNRDSRSREELYGKAMWTSRAVGSHIVRGSQ